MSQMKARYQYIIKDSKRLEIARGLDTTANGEHAVSVLYKHTMDLKPRVVGYTKLTNGILFELVCLDSTTGFLPTYYVEFHELLTRRSHEV